MLQNRQFPMLGFFCSKSLLFLMLHFLDCWHLQGCRALPRSLQCAGAAATSCQHFLEPVSCRTWSCAEHTVSHAVWHLGWRR
jgi:hypothetical protein